jgi:hypothetical protein
MDRSGVIKKIERKCSMLYTRVCWITVSSQQHSLQRKLRLKFKDTFMLQQAQLKKFPSPSERDIRNIEVWHRNTNHYAIEDEEKSYLTQKHDLFSLVPREKSPLRKLLDTSRLFRHLLIFKKRHTPKMPLYNTSWVHYFSDKSMDRCVTVVIVSIGTLMLISPMWILQALGSRQQKLWVITLFLLSFVMMISYATVARPFEILAATAA